MPCSCNAGYRISATLAVFGRVGIMSEYAEDNLAASFTCPIQAVWGIRTAALYQGNLLVTGFLAFLGLVIVVLAAVYKILFNHCQFKLKNIPL